MEDLVTSKINEHKLAWQATKNNQKRYNFYFWFFSSLMLDMKKKLLLFAGK